MAVYLCASSLRYATQLGTKTSYQFGIEKSLPYFLAFPEDRLALTKLYQYIDEHIENCVKQAGWQLNEIKHMPIFLGSTGYVITDCEVAYMASQPLSNHYSLTKIGDYLQQKYQSQVFNLATSCTSSAQGIYYASKMLRQGLCHKALVIGFESFNQLTFEHFYSMGLLAECHDYQPFNQSNGLILGEGIACLALSNQASKDFYCEILAEQSLTDNVSLTNNNLQLLKQLVNNIYQTSRIVANQLQGIKPHAIGGIFDEIEKDYLQQLFPQTGLLLLKQQTGHTLGASGAIETALLLQGLQAKQQIRLQKNNQNLTALSEPLAKGYYLNYFLGFAGSNVGWLLNWQE